jgi:hypothetical protein
MKTEAAYIKHFFPEERLAKHGRHKLKGKWSKRAEEVVISV